MMNVDRKHDITYIGAIYGMGNVFGICPYYSFASRQLKHKVANNVYLLLVAASYLIAAYYSIVEVYSHALLRMSFLQAFNAATTTISLNLHPFVNAVQVLRCKDLWQELLAGVQSVDECYRRVARPRKRSCYWLELVAGHLVIFYIIFGMITFRLLNGRLPNYEIVDTACRYVLYLRCILLYNLAVCLGHRFSTVSENFINLDEAYSIHVKLSNLVAIFNRLFGFDILLLFVDMLSNIVLFINVLLYPFRAKTPWEIPMQTVRIVHGCFTLVTVTGITWACEQASSNAAGISLVAVRAMQRGESPEKLRLLYRRLKRRPRFTVCGIFELNSSNLLGSFGALVAYLILALNTKQPAPN